MSNHEMFGAEEGWVAPSVGDLVECQTGRKIERGVVVPPNDYIKRDDLWCQVVLDGGRVKVFPKKDVKVIQSGTE